jgi:hypothetical protein
MTTETTLDYAKPYEIMCGIWTGMANVYGPDGEYWDSAPSRVVMYWKDANTLSYNQIEEHDEHGFLKGRDKALRKAASDIVRVSFDLAIRGKAAKGSSDVFDVVGTESMPGVYLFQLKAKDGSGTYFNNQYFLDASQRNIVGPFVGPGGSAVQVVAQSFARVSYDVPKQYRG